MNILKTLPRLEAPTERPSGKQTFLKCREIMKDCESEHNTLKILKGTNFWQSCRPPFCNFVEKSTPLQLFLVCLSFKNTCFKQKSNNFEMQCISCHSRFTALDFQLSRLVRV